MKNLKPNETALVVFAAVCIFAAQFALLLDTVTLTDSKIFGIVFIVLWSLYYAILIGMSIKKYERKIAVIATIVYLIGLPIFLFTLIF
ncbi:MAG: hypothetical protein ACI4W6_10940 [Acutalibacteraceae bacterium]